VYLFNTLSGGKHNTRHIYKTQRLSRYYRPNSHNQPFPTYSTLPDHRSDLSERGAEPAGDSGRGMYDIYITEG
jgi:hypothetical protein